MGLVREAHDEYASSLDVEAGQKETSWLSEIEVTAKQCRADMEIYFKRCLPTTTGTVDHSSKAKSSMASVIHQQTERTLNKLTEDLAKEQDEDRELQGKAIEGASPTGSRATCSPRKGNSGRADESLVRYKSGGSAIRRGCEMEFRRTNHQHSESDLEK